MGKNPHDPSNLKIKKDLLDPCFEYRNQQHLSALLHQAQGHVLLRHVRRVSLLKDLDRDDPTYNMPSSLALLS